MVVSSHCQHPVGQSDIHQTLSVVPVSMTLICIQGHSKIEMVQLKLFSSLMIVVQVGYFLLYRC